MDNPWLVAIISGVIAAVLAGFILYYVFEYRREKISRAGHITRINEADRLLKANMTEDALWIYSDVLKAVSKEKEAKVYGRIKNNEAICYYNLALASNKEDNLTKAIRAYEEALKIYTVEEYPLYHKVVLSNMVSVKQNVR